MNKYARLFVILVVAYGLDVALFVPHCYYFDRGDHIVVKGWADWPEVVLVSLIAGGFIAVLATSAFAISERWFREAPSSD